MPFPPIHLPSRVSSPRKELFRRKKSRDDAAPPPEREPDKDKRSTSWPSSALAKGKPERDAERSWLRVPKASATSCDSVPRSSSGDSSHRYASRSSLAKEQEIRFSLSLTPEAVLVIQKRQLEKQMMAKQQKCCADPRHRRVFPSKRVQGGGRSSDDVSAILKISLLNDQHKYDDVEYEEEDGDVDETVVRKCREWLKGVESAAAFAKADKLSSLPHLKS